MRQEDMYESEIEAEREMRSRAEKDAWDVAGVVAALAGMAILAWLFLAATPSQRSAEAEAFAEAVEGAR